MTTTNTTPAHELPYGGTIRDLRLLIARGAQRGEKAFNRLTTPPGRRWTDAEAEEMHVAHGASLNGWALASILGWLQEEHPDVALEAAAIVQDLGENGGTEYCDDLMPDLEPARD